jgi:diguanylate cyclase (GGDEF)-like protein
MSEDQPQRQRFVAHSFAALYGLGGLVVGVTVLLPHPHDRVLAGLLGVVAAAGCVTTVLLIWGPRLPPRTLWVLPPLGSLLITIVSYSSGIELRVTCSTFYFWAIGSAFYFFPRRVAAPNVPLVAVLYGAELIIGHQDFVAIRYLVPMAALTVSALLIDRLNAERARLQDELQSMIAGLDAQARTDPVTGLPNRREFERNLAREIARATRSGAPLTVLMIDLDHFKTYNDTYGHPAGDTLLRRAAAAWAARLRGGDLLVRYGGDEFAAILPDCRLTDARELALRLREATPQQERCSIGIATWRSHDTAEHVIFRADEALLAAKRNGRNEIRTELSAVGA